MLVRQFRDKNLPYFQGAIKIKELKNKEFRTTPPEIREFKKLQYKSVDPREVDEISQFFIEHIAENKEHFIGTITFGVLHAEEAPLQLLPLPLQRADIEEIRELKNIGILQIEQEPWIPMDGLHRYYAILKVLRELPPYKREIFENEEIPITLIPCSSLNQLQDLMLRLQKSVRAVDRGEAIRTASHDDKFAQLARKVCGIDGTNEGILPEKLVNWKTNTLTNRLQKFTTLSVLYDSAKILYPDLSDQTFFSQNLSLYYDEFAQIWKMLIENFRPFSEAIRPTTDKALLRDKYICLKATGQLVIIQIIKLALQNEGPEAVEKAIDGLNRIPWNIEHSIWNNILLINGRLNAGYSARILAAQLIAYHIGITQSDKEVDELRRKYKEAKHDELPSPLYNRDN
ncbi:MAG TPA: DNA sulfur modification protein DndB [Ktedonobacteraceae bacterium]|jgi:hypothetical protein|nr:DNA sulfur modification protein DndB [Ktedonobacteraceae bacterium]